MVRADSNIAAFFRNQTVFLTGGSGFLGKILIQKLLRECEDLTKIYVLLRPKKSKTSAQRFQELFDYPCFDLIKATGINIKDKVFLIEGDCLEPFLGLSEADMKLLKEEVTCVIHAAANVKFDQSLKEAAYNARATRDILLLAKEMVKLKVYVHVSTAYSNCIHNHVQEEFYEPPMGLERLLAIVENLDEDALQVVTPLLLGKWPNTYVYTKSISEGLVRTVGKDLPATIVRPAIVVSTAEDPIPGWIDNFYGVIGIVAGAALGVIRSLHAKPDSHAYLVPVDYVSNLVLAAAWNTQINERKIIIYNFVGSKNNFLTWKELQERIEPLCMEAASEKVLWHYTLKIRENKIWHEICVFFLHTVQAYIVDFVLLCIGRPRIAVQNYRRLDKMLKLISYFSTQTWYFDIDNVTKLWHGMETEDRKRFNFSMEKFDWDRFGRDAVFGARFYLLKDTLDTIPKGKRKLRMLFVAHYTLLALFWFLMFKLVMFLINLLT